MNAHPVLAIVAVSDFATSSAWYTRLFGRAPDNGADAGCAEWNIATRTKIQVLPGRDPAAPRDRSSAASLGIMVADLDEVLAGLQGRQIEAAAPQPATHYMRFIPVSDPDGNVVTFLESMPG